MHAIQKGMVRLKQNERDPSRLNTNFYQKIFTYNITPTRVFTVSEKDINKSTSKYYSP